MHSRVEKEWEWGALVRVILDSRGIACYVPICVGGASFKRYKADGGYKKALKQSPGLNVCDRTARIHFRAIMVSMVGILEEKWYVTNFGKNFFLVYARYVPLVLCCN